VHPQWLRLPTLDELRTWLEELEDRHGRTPHLMAKAAVGIGLRAEEVILLQADQVPPIPSGMAKEATMKICYGTKGGRDPLDPDRRGKARNVRVRRELLIQTYWQATGL
jgi:hypothetical protein